MFWRRWYHRNIVETCYVYCMVCILFVFFFMYIGFHWVENDYMNVYENVTRNRWVLDHRAKQFWTHFSWSLHVAYSLFTQHFLLYYLVDNLRSDGCLSHWKKFRSIKVWPIKVVSIHQSVFPGQPALQVVLEIMYVLLDSRVWYKEWFSPLFFFFFFTNHISTRTFLRRCTVKWNEKKQHRK